MKQNISWKQLTELTFEQIKVLQKLINQKYHLVKNAEHWEEVKNHKYITEDGAIFNIHTSYVGFLEKTNIGQMIEILHNKEWTVVIIQKSGRSEVKITRGLETHIFNDKKLCDALWEAVKEVIN